MDINIKVNKATRDAIPDKNKIGVEGENLQEKLVFYFEDEFVDGIARLEYEQDGVKNYIPLEKIDETYVVPVKSIITKAWKLNLQLVITENEQSEGIPLFKSDIFEVYVTNSINAVDEAPEGYDLWIDIANAKLLLMDEKINEANDAIENISTAIQEVDNLDIDVEETSTGSTIKITKKDGTKKDVIVPKSDQYDDTELRQLIAQKQNALISGINIKTINNETILGEGNIDLSNYKLYSNDDITLWYSYTGVKNIENINAEIEGESHNILEILPMFLTSPISEMQYIIGEMAVFLKMFKVPSTSYIDPTTSQYLFVDMPFLGELALTIIESNGEYTFSFIRAHSVYENIYDYTVDISNETPVLEIVYALSDKQNTSARVTTLSESSTDTQYPSAKCVYNYVNDSIENVITGKGLVNNTDYATSNKGGVIKTSNYYDTEIDSSGALRSKVVSYVGYPNESNNAFISKGTLDNVLNAKIGDIDSVLDTINGEVI